MKKTLQNPQLWRLLPLLLATALVLAIPGAVFAKSVVWTNYDFDVTVQTNGDLRVVETQVIDFQGGPFHEGFATIPLENTDGITDVSVSENGIPYKEGSNGPGYFVTSNDGNTLTVDWGMNSTTDETRTFQLAYTVHGAVRQYASGDILRYGLIALSSGDDDFTIYSSKATIHLPDGGPIINDPDSIGAPMQWQTALDNGSVTYQSTGSFNASDGFAIEVVFKHGAITGPVPTWQAAYDRQATYDSTVKPIIDLTLWAISLAMLVAVPGLLYLIWYLFGRDPSPSIAPDYLPEPPSDLPPGLAGVLIDERADLRDVTASIIDLARRGFLTMEEGQAAGAFATTAKTYTLHKAGNGGPLRPYEQLLYTSLFSAGDAVNMNAMPAAFFNALPRIENLMYEEVVKAELFRSNPETARSHYRTVGVILVGVAVLAGCLLSTLTETVTVSVLCPVVPIVLFGLGLAILASYMPARTRKGAEESAKWKAFQTYLGNIQKYKDLGSAADQFEKFLAYAIAFGLERRWIGAFSQAPAQSGGFVPIPMWYRPWGYGYGGFPVGGMGAGAGAGGLGGVGGAAPSLPNLNQMGAGLSSGLNSFGDSFTNALNAAGRGISTPPAPTYTYSGGGSRGYSGGRSTFRSGGGFRGGGGGRGFSGGGGRGFR